MNSLPMLLTLAICTSLAFAQPLPAGHPAVNTRKEATAAPDVQLPQKAKVLSTIDAPPYTYLEVTQNKKTLWLAANGVRAKKGDVVRFDDGTIMTNFPSTILKRTFPSVTFVNRLVVTNEKE